MNRQTVATFNFVSREITLSKTNPHFVQTIPYGEDKQAMHKAMWYILHSPKLIEVRIITSYYSKDILSMVRYCEMIGLDVSILVDTQMFSNSREFQTWFAEQQTRRDEHAISVECLDLLIKHAPELLKFAKKSNAELIEVLRSQIRNSGYDVSMSSIFTTDGLNSGVVEDAKGKHTWSRTYTKHYERYDETLKDLLLMYISCKFYAKSGFEADFNNRISESDIDSYTGEVIDEPIQIRVRDEEVVVPQSACSLGVQMYMS